MATNLIWLEQAYQDLRYALRQFRSSPGFTLAVTLSLACGIGANTASFSAINSLLLKSLPVRDPQQLIQLDSANTQDVNTLRGFSYPGFEILRKASAPVLSGLFAYTTNDASSAVFPALSSCTLIYHGNAAIAKGMLASESMYNTLGVEPALGRFFQEGDAGVLVLSYNYWQSRFGADPSIAGRVIIVNQVPFTIIGVTPSEFRGIELGYSPDFTAPLSMAGSLKLNTLSNGSEWWLAVMARKKPGVSDQQVQTTLGPAFHQTLNDLVQSTPTAMTRDIQKMVTGLRLKVNPANQGAISTSRDELRRGLQYLSAMVLLLLAIACVNLANLVLARTANRQTEIRIRLSVGASSSRVFRQLLTEILLLAFIGCVVALPFAWFGAPLLINIFSDASIVESLSLTPDWRVFLFSLLSALVCGLFVGVVPVLQIAKTRLTKARAQAPAFLMVTQIALALLLTAGAGLLVRSFQNIRQIDPGFRPDKVLTFTVTPSSAGYSGAREQQFYHELTARLSRLLPGNFVSYATFAPGRSAMGTLVRVPGEQPRTQGEPVGVNTIAPGYFDAVGIELLRGRAFGSSESSVAIVNQAFARRYFASKNPLGKAFTLLGNETKPIEIVGLVRDVKEHGLLTPAPLMAYLPYQSAGGGEMTFFIRTKADPQYLIPAVRAELKLINPLVSLSGLGTLKLQLSDSIAREQALAAGSSLMGLLALALASIGLYGVIAYSVDRQTKSIGIRIALGAQTSIILWGVFRRVLMIVCAGLAIGLAGVLFFSRYLTSILYGLSPGDPVTIASAAAILTTVSLTAAYLPARRASRIDPAVCLRNE